MKKPFKLTHSKSEMKEQCPRKFYLMEGSKCLTGKPIIPFQTSKALEDGNYKHELIEDYIKVGSLGADPKGFWRPWWGELIDKYKARYSEFSAEKKIGLGPDWSAHSLGDYYKPMFPDTEIIIQSSIDFSLFDTKECATRGGSEYAIVIDWKSGKPRKPSKIGQLGLYALFLFCMHPFLEQIDCYFVFLDHKKKHEERYFRNKDLDSLKKLFRQKYNEINNLLILADSTSNHDYFFEAKKSPLCGWCLATREHCEYGTS